MWLAHIRDTVRFLRIENRPESIADYPLFIKLLTTRTFHNRMGWPHGYRSCDMGCCAYASVTNDGASLIEIQAPIPAYCPYPIEKASQLLLNHEVMHLTLETVLDEDEDDISSDLWDHPKTTKLLNKILPSVYCHCDAKTPEDLI